MAIAVQSWATVVVTSLQNLWMGVVNVLDEVAGALVILIVGLIVASGLSKLIEKVIELLKVDKLLKSLGVDEHVERAGLHLNSGKFLGKITYWFFLIVVLLAVSDILSFTTLSGFLRDVLLYIPNVFVAVLIMLAATVVGNFLRTLVRSSVKSARLKGAKFLGSLTWWSVIVFGFLAAMAQLGVAQGIVSTLVGGMIAMIALAGGIAFGLGGKSYAEFFVSRLREHHEE